MARARTADDEVLALLALHALPMPAAEIARELGWEKSMASKVLTRLAPRLAVTTEAGRGGTPTKMFTLKCEDRPAAGMPPRLRYEKGSFLVTPSGREARVVLHRRDGYVELEFLDGPRDDARSTLHERLVKPFQPGREKPTPVRLT